MSTLYVPKFDVSVGDWTGYRVPFRDTLLQALYSDIQAAILKTNTDPHHRSQMIAALAAGVDGLALDFATGAKKHGEFIATDKAVSRRFWETPEQAVAYGSNLLTGCCQPVKRLTLRVLVVEDGQHGTGDCHAKMCTSLARVRLGCVERAAQFRLVHDRYLAKGTMITYAPHAPPMQTDVIIPLSAFKSARKPTLGMHYWPEVYLGIQGWSERRQVKLSYTVLQWFSRRTIDADVWPRVEPQLRRLVEAGRSVETAAELLHLDEVDPDDPDERLLARILTADVHGYLTTHPWVIRAITRMLRRRWLHLALGGGLRFVGLQGLPDDSLPIGVISTPDLPYGPLIATRYPVRSWADVRLWRNARRREHRGHKGVVWMSHETACLVGEVMSSRYRRSLELPVFENSAVTEPLDLQGFFFGAAYRPEATSQDSSLSERPWILLREDSGVRCSWEVFTRWGD